MAQRKDATTTTIDYVCGLRKISNNRYSLVTGRVVDGVADIKMDPIAQELHLAAELLRDEFQRLMRDIP